MDEKQSSMNEQEFIKLLHTLPIDQIGNLQRIADNYVSTWFGFSEEFKKKQTPEWIEKARWRLDGKIEPCCKCGEDYPRFDLHFLGEIYCNKCRKL